MIGWCIVDADPEMSRIATLLLQKTHPVEHDLSAITFVPLLGSDANVADLSILYAYGE